ncbi:MAG: thiosulfate oxidation carrier protein SoxY [Hyphomicrobiaceae bacterium]
MRDMIRLEQLDRRDFVLGSAAVAALAAIVPLGSMAHAQQKSGGWQALLKEIAGDATPATAKITIQLPEIAENGNTVPFSVAVDSPMTDKDYVKTVHVISTGNPLPHVASFNFTPASGKAGVSSRMRLGKTQDVLVVAQMSDGKFYMGKRLVKVTIGGCGG